MDATDRFAKMAARESRKWLEVFDRIDMGDIREQAKRNRAAVPQRHGIAAALHRELSNAFDPANFQQCSRTEETMSIENDLVYGTRAIAEFLEIPIQRCRELIAAGHLPTFTMPGASTRCARKSSLNATWAAYEEQVMVSGSSTDCKRVRA